jgi:ECF transporter S component (folate family)
MFISLALVMQMATAVFIPLFGTNGVRVGLSGIFNVMPALLFGPVYGAIAMGLFDLIQYMLRPTGAFLPWMTLILMAGAFLRGFLWQLLKDKNVFKMRLVVVIICAVFLGTGIFNVVALRADGVDRWFYDTYINEVERDNGDIVRRVTSEIDTVNMHTVSRMIISRTIGEDNPDIGLEGHIVFMTSVLIGSGIFCLILLFADGIISKFFVKSRTGSRLMPLVITMLVGGIFVSTFNTIFLRETMFTSWKLLPFYVVWVPRVITNIVNSVVHVYFIVVMLGLLERRFGDYI